MHLLPARDIPVPTVRARRRQRARTAGRSEAKDGRSPLRARGTVPRQGPGLAPQAWCNIEPRFARVRDAATRKADRCDGRRSRRDSACANGGTCVRTAPTMCSSPDIRMASNKSPAHHVSWMPIHRGNDGRKAALAGLWARSVGGNDDTPRTGHGNVERSDGEGRQGWRWRPRRNLSRNDRCCGDPPGQLRIRAASAGSFWPFGNGRLLAFELSKRLP